MAKLDGGRGHGRIGPLDPPAGRDLSLKPVGGKQCDGKSFPPPGREAATFAARGSGGALKLPSGSGRVLPPNVDGDFIV